MKSIQKWSISCPHSPLFGLYMEIYRVKFTEKIWTRENFTFEHFWPVIIRMFQKDVPEYVSTQPEVFLGPCQDLEM